MTGRRLKRGLCHDSLDDDGPEAAVVDIRITSAVMVA